MVDFQHLDKGGRGVAFFCVGAFFIGFAMIYPKLRKNPQLLKGGKKRAEEPPAPKGGKERESEELPTPKVGKRRVEPDFDLIE
jgi:hypothetical protein